MVAAAMFFKGHGGGQELPYLQEYLLCEHFHWTWADLAATPAPVVSLWTLYRNLSVQIGNQQAEQTG